MGKDRKVKKTNEEWRKILAPEQYKICRGKGTESPFANEYFDCHEKGIYLCACCGEPLFRSEEKFDSGTGWPSFRAPISPGAVSTVEDKSVFMTRTEVLCKVCDAHLGHVFPDGPAPTRMRYCINSGALKLDKDCK